MRFDTMKVNSIAELTVVFCLIHLAVTIAAAQDGTRSITSDDFAKQRPAAASSTGKRPVKRPPKTYKFVRADKNVVGPRKQPISTPATVKLTPKVTEIGVTMWKMRPPRKDEVGQLLPVIDETKTRRNWLAERVGLDTVFKAGDKVRFAIESSTTGYLYVIDRETFSNGSIGAPFLIFPESPEDDNSVRPGMLVDIPDQREDVPYFNIDPKKPNYTGELLTVIISPTRLTNIKTNDEGMVTNSDELKGIELGAEVEIFSRSDTTDRVYSKAESESACGVKSRKLERAKSTDSPCGDTRRQLTREEALPQSIYRVKGFVGLPAAAFIKLSVE